MHVVAEAGKRDTARREQASLLAELQERLASLTPREREVMALAVAGRPNKQIAHLLRLSQATVKVHRSHVMRKMRARSLIDLVRMTDRLGVLANKA